MKKPVRIVLSGAGGYGEGYVRAALEGQARGVYALEGIVQPAAAKAEILQNEAASVPVFETMEDFFREKQADFAVVSSPIQFHAAQSVCAMENGCHVLCEKPACAVIDDAFAMEAAAARLKRRLFVGFQWSMCRPILDLKRDILEGRYGAVRRMHAAVLWPRDGDYYKRPWAGRIKDETGYILDSVAMNATAHYLHNLLFLAGGSEDAAARPDFLEAALLRANDIENYDTIALRMRTASGAAISYLATHACERAQNPSFFLEFERGSVSFGPAEGVDRLTGDMDGAAVDYGVPGGTHGEKLAFCLSNGEPVSTISSAIPHVLCMNAVSEFVPVRAVEEGRLAKEGGVTFVPGLFEALDRAHRSRAMPWEMSDLFGEPTEIDIREYSRFRGIKGEVL